VSVSTAAGVVATTFKQGDRYYLRSWPVAENGSTIPSSLATTEGWAREPFLLLDPLVGKADVGNHVLLEPDPTGDAYHVRKVTLDPATGAVSWDAAVSYGAFALPVSAAALHASGRVVVVHTDSGRLGIVEPADVGAHPPLATFYAGPGTTPGLLQSPVAVAVTHEGVVLVLEAGANRIAAFDLLGKPLTYFPGNAFTAPLARDATYLDLAVDGSGHCYALSYTGTGAAAADFHHDVYTPAGQPLVTLAAGVNAAALAVDYWRSVYTASYGPLITAGTATARVDPALGVQEPTVSRFDPQG
jgi:hypothetical protein